MELGRTIATYKLRSGVAEACTQHLAKELRTTPFSLNSDEATISSNRRVPSVLSNHFPPQNQKTTTNHLASLELDREDSKTIFDAVCDIFTRYELPWTNLISVLFDSCAVMRGVKNGVETRNQREKAPQLYFWVLMETLNHHIHSISKAFCGPFGSHLEDLFQDLHTDFKYCAEHKSFLMEICSALGLAYSSPGIFGTARWLSVYDKSVVEEMLEAFQLFCYPFLDTDKEAYRPIIYDILKTKNVSYIDRKRLHSILDTLTNKKLTMMERRGRTGRFKR